MLTLAIGFISVGLLLATFGELIRRGHTWLIAGYDPARVTDERGLAEFCGSSVLLMAAVAAFAGGLAATLPDNFGLIAVLLFSGSIVCGALLLLVGVRRYMKRLG